MAGNIITFPENLAELIDQDGSFPHVCFTSNIESPEIDAIHLYVPQGISIQDSASYEGINLGEIKAARALAAGGEADSSESEAAGFNFMKQYFPGGDAVAGDALLNRRQAINPQTELAFQNMNLRTFGFQFKLVPESRNESVYIRQIENFFRKYMYPEKQSDIGFVVKYPAQFRIQFYNGEKESTFLPTIYDAYISDLTVAYNADGNTFHPYSEGGEILDHAPTSVDINITFSEGKMMTRGDIYYTEGEDAEAYPPRTKQNDERPATIGGPSTQGGG